MEIAKKIRAKRRKKLIISLLIALIGCGILIGVLYLVQMNYAIDKQIDNSKIKLDIAHQRIEDRENEANSNMESYDDFSQSKLDTIGYFYSKNPKMITGFVQMAKKWDLAEMYMVDSNRKVVASCGSKIMTTTQMEQLIKSQKPFTQNNIRYYITVCNDGKYLLAGRDCSKLLESQKNLTSYSSSLKTIKVGETGHIFAYDISTDKVLYSENADNIGKNISAINSDKSKFENGYKDWLTIDNEKYYADCLLSGKTMYISLIPKQEMMQSVYRTILLAMLMYILVVGLIILYVYFANNEEEQKVRGDKFDINYIHLTGNIYFNSDTAKKTKNILVIGIVAIFMLTWYSHSLASLSWQSARLTSKINDIETIIDDNQDRLSQITKEYNEEYEGRAENLAYLIDLDKTLVNDKYIADLAKKAHVQNLYVINANGTLDASNSPFKDFQLSKDPADQSYEFWNIIRGYTDSIVQEAQKDDTVNHNYLQYIGVKRLDTDGIVQIGVSPKRLEERTKGVQLSHVLSNIAVENKGIIFAVNKENFKYVYAPDSQMINKSALDYGISKQACKDGYSGYQTISDVKYFCECRDYAGYYLFVGQPINQIMNGRFSLSAVATGISAVIILIISCVVLILRKRDIDDIVEEAKQEPTDLDEQRPLIEPKGIIEIVNSSGEKRKVESVTSRWDSKNKTKWVDKTAEQKIKTVLGVLFVVFGISLVIYSNFITDKNVIMTYIYNVRWDKTPSIFSITYIGIICIQAIVITGVVQFLIKTMTSDVGARSETIGRLINNFLKYIVALGVIFYNLSFLGINATTLLASAGIVTLVIGLGAQSLIGDILAGIFIVFEKEFQVGDIITVGEWRGTVMEIGIRSTKIEDWSHNIKSMSNSQIKGVVNMTKMHSLVTCDISIEYGESLERVESILETELPLFMKRIPEIESGPFYKGVVSLGESSVVLRVLAQCKEADRIQLGRDLNREMKLMFDRHNINIPFPQVVVNRPANFEKETAEEKIDAEKYVNEQREITKDVVADDSY